MQTFRLGSSPAVYAPGIVEWAKHGFLFPETADHMVKMVSECWSIPAPAATALLDGTAPFIVEGEVVVFSAEVAA